MIMNTSVDEIRKLLDAGPRIVITMHRGPDGDAIGSSLAWHHILKLSGIESTVIAPDAYPDFLKWLPGNENILVFESQAEKAKEAVAAADLIFCLDFNAASRMGDLEETITKANKPIVVVDHHQDPSDFANFYYVDSDACSTAQMIFRLSQALDFSGSINREAAYCLYTGLVTDTGSFRYTSVTPEVMRIAAQLMETGIDHTQVYQEVFDSNSEDQVRLRGYAISEKMVVMPEAGAAHISLSEKELQRFNFRKGDTEGLVNVGLSIHGVKVAAFFAERDGIIKISIRSSGDFDVNKFARTHFEGGGHINAAGGRYKGKIEDAISRYETAVKELAQEILKS